MLIIQILLINKILGEIGESSTSRRIKQIFDPKFKHLVTKFEYLVIKFEYLVTKFITKHST